MFLSIAWCKKRDSICENLYSTQEPWGNWVLLSILCYVIFTFIFTFGFHLSAHQGYTTIDLFSSNLWNYLWMQFSLMVDGKLNFSRLCINPIILLQTSKSYDGLHWLWYDFFNIYLCSIWYLVYRFFFILLHIW